MRFRQKIGFAAFGFAAIYAAGAGSFMMEYIASNVTPSAPAGLYLRDRDGEYVTFCLTEAQVEIYGSFFCSPKNPDGARILKPVIGVEESAVVVQSAHMNGIDSRVLGPIPDDQVRHRWALVLSYWEDTD